MIPGWKTLRAVLLLALMTSACAGNSVWVPPSSISGGSPAQPLAELAPETAPATAAIDPPAVTLPPVVTDSLPLSATLASPAPAVTLASTAVLEPTAETPAITVTQAVNTPGPTPDTTPILYYAQAADTLPVLAVRYGVKETEISSPDPIPETGFLNPGQLLIIPRRLMNTTSSRHLLPDSEVVYSPSTVDFDVQAFVNKAGGKLAGYHEWLKSTGTVSGAQIIERVALENSINPRLLLSLLEYQTHWVYSQPATPQDEEYPMGKVDLAQKGLYNQLVWAVNKLSIGYYAWREGRMSEIAFPDGVRAHMAPDLNAGSAALQYFFGQLYEGQRWLDALDVDKGLPATHKQMFGDPWERAQLVEPLFPPGLSQPPFILPFLKGWVWAFTGGPHGAWEHDGAYAALDFAPGSTESGCVKTTTYVTAAASGLVTRSGGGIVVEDLDGDGKEQTGWVMIYLHVSSENVIPVGSWVGTGEVLGHPSCEGGIATGTHVHLARKFNGEWIPADGPIPFNLGGWVAHYSGVAYQGTLTRDSATVTACVCSNAATFIIRGPNDP